MVKLSPLRGQFKLSMSQRVLILFGVIVLLCSACKRVTVPVSPDSRQAEMDAYCTDRGKEDLSDGEKQGQVKAFYSWKIHTCVQIEEEDSADSGWSYELRDVLQGFLRGPQTVRSEMPLKVYHYDYRDFKTVSAEGFWVSTDASKDKQLVQQIVAKIDCNSSEKSCKEHDAELFGGLLHPELEEYKVTKWDGTGVVADDDEGGTCNLGHRLAIDFSSNSVVVTDYPLKAGGRTDCKAFQNANSYSLHGGSIGIMGTDSIFSCTKDGINSVIINKVNELHGHVMDKPYIVWMDNGEGGPPATLKTPDHPFSQVDCKRAMDKMVSELSL
jgi:hypothetical protein